MELFITEDAGYRLDCTRSTFILHGREKTTIPHLDAGEKIEVVEMNIDEFIEAVLDGKIQARDLQREFLIFYRKDPNLSELKEKILGII